jgi:hypothetical protein
MNRRALTDRRWLFIWFRFGAPRCYAKLWRYEVPCKSGSGVDILRKERSGFRQKAPARQERALTPSKRLKLSPAGPMVLHVLSVWESFGKLRINCGRCRHK